MATPVFTQQQADALIAVPKWARSRVELRAATRHAKPWEKKYEFHVDADPPFAKAEFRVEMISSTLTDAFTMILIGRLPGGVREGLCRYDVQDRPHLHKSRHCMGPPVILPGEFHVHRYCEAVVRENRPWGHCAEVIAIKPGTVYEQKCELAEAFLAGIGLRFEDDNDRDDLFSLVTP